MITEKQEPTRADIEKARRKLDQKVAGGVLVRVDGTRGGASDGQKGGTPAAWFLCDREPVVNQSRVIHEICKAAGQINHGTFTPRSVTEINHGQSRPTPENRETAGRSITRTNHDHSRAPSPSSFVFLSSLEERNVSEGTGLSSRHQSTPFRRDARAPALPGAKCRGLAPRSIRLGPGASRLCRSAPSASAAALRHVPGPAALRAVARQPDTCSTAARSRRRRIVHPPKPRNRKANKR